MKKILLFAALLFAFSGKLFAQSSSNDGGKFSIGFNAGLPVGSANDAYSATLGGDLKYSFPVAPNLFLSLSAGYTELIGKTFSYSYSDGNSSYSYGGTASNLGVVPLKFGARYSANGSTGFFGEVQFGAAIISQGGGTDFLYSPGIGYAFNSGVEAGVRYEGWDKDGTFSQIALRVAYNF